MSGGVTLTGGLVDVAGFLFKRESGGLVKRWGMDTKVTNE